MAAHEGSRPRGRGHVEAQAAIRSAIEMQESEKRFWTLTVTNPDISAAVGAPVSGLVDEVAGGVVAYVLGGEKSADVLAAVLNKAFELESALAEL